MKRSQTTKNQWSIGLVCALVVVLLTAPSASAGENGTGTVRVKSAKQVSTSAVWTDVIADKKRVTRVIANFTSHKESSVKLTTFKMCWSVTGGATEDILMYIDIKGKNVWKGPKKYYSSSGSCHSYTVNRTFKGSPGKEMFVIRPVLGFSRTTFVHGYYR